MSHYGHLAFGTTRRRTWIGYFHNFQTSVPFTLDQVIWQIVVSTYIPNLLKMEKLFVDERRVRYAWILRPTLLGQIMSRPKCASTKLCELLKQVVHCFIQLSFKNRQLLTIISGKLLENAWYSITAATYVATTTVFGFKSPASTGEASYAESSTGHLLQPIRDLLLSLHRQQHKHLHSPMQRQWYMWSVDKLTNICGQFVNAHAIHKQCSALNQVYVPTSALWIDLNKC